MKEQGRVNILIIILVFIFICCMSVFIWYRSALGAVQSNSEKVVINIENGNGISNIADILESNGIIKNANVFKIYCKLHNRTALQAGKYELDKNMSLNDIINKLENGEILDETVTITFIEGKNMRWIAKTIDENTENSEKDVFEL